MAATKAQYLLKVFPSLDLSSLSADLEESRSLYLQGNLQQYSTNRGKRKRESCFDQTSLSSPSSSSTFDIDWTHLKSWPQGLVEEEKAMIDYYRRLKLSHIEQETKNVFIHSIRDEPIKEKAYKDQRDKVQKVYSAEEVQELEVQVQKSKEELKERKRIAMEIRSHIESLADELGEMETLQGEVQEAQELADTIQELEVEWETLKARQDPNKGGAIAKKELSEMLKKEVMTTKGEALALYQQREREMQDLQSEEDSTKKAISRYQKELMGQKESLILLKEEQFGLEEIRERLIRDPKTEAQYKSKLATLTVLKGVLGITLIDAPASNILQSVYKVQDCQAKLVHNEVAVLIYFTHPGSRIKAYKVSVRMLIDTFESKKSD